MDRLEGIYEHSVLHEIFRMDEAVEEYDLIVIFYESLSGLWFSTFKFLVSMTSTFQ